ncbi:MAG: homoserine dehydrogenase [Acidobacteria bacterium]|nr:homoserine dehydrogenase [Acidobacteriota bacterium]
MRHLSGSRVALDLALVGFGNVARRFVRLLQERADGLRSDPGVDVRVIGISTRRHGAALALDGLDAIAAADAVERGGALQRFHDEGAGLPAGTIAFINRAASAHRHSARELVMVETTVLDINAGQPAIDHVRAAFASGAHVVTANKGPVAFAYRELAQMADAAGVEFRFESAVMDGIPVFNLARETLPGATVRGFRGVINSTTNYILTAMEEGRSFDEALRDMQADGVAEADASLDLDGWDAAAKVAALANVLMDARITPGDVRRTGIRGVRAEDVREARARGRRVKLVASAARRDETVIGRVEPVDIPSDDVLANLPGMSNAVVLETDVLGRLAVIEIDCGLTQTAYGLLSDLLGVATGLAPRRARRGRIP